MAARAAVRQPTGSLVVRRLDRLRHHARLRVLGRVRRPLRRVQQRRATPCREVRRRCRAEVTSVAAQQLTTANRRFRFTFAVDEAGTTECRIVGESSFAPCTSPVELTVPVGDQRFEVRGTDASGNVGAARAVDVVGVDTFLYSWAHPRSSTAEFSYDSVEGAEFFCSLDYAAFQACGTGQHSATVYTGLADGTHAFRVYARKGAFVQQHPVVHEWQIDTVAPTTTVDTVDLRPLGVVHVPGCRDREAGVPAHQAGRTRDVGGLRLAGLLQGPRRRHPHLRGPLHRRRGQRRDSAGPPQLDRRPARRRRRPRPARPGSS